MTLPNIVKFSSGKIAPPLRTGDVAIDEVCPQLLNRVMELRASAQYEVHRVISLLDSSVSNTRKIASRIVNPGVRAAIENELVKVESKLRIAQQKALELSSDQRPVSRAPRT